MPATLTYPGIYVQEIPSGVHPIAGASTSDTAFVDAFAQGPFGVPVRLTSFEEFARVFGGLSPSSEASYGVQQYFLNGGSTAWIVRVTGGSATATPEGSARRSQVMLTGGSAPQNTLLVRAANAGAWGEQLFVGVDHAVSADLAATGNGFNLAVQRRGAGGVVLASEVHRNLTLDRTSSRYAPSVVNNASALVTLTDEGLGSRPALTGAPAPAEPGDVTSPAAAPSSFTQVHDGAHVGFDGNALDGSALTFGVHALDQMAPATFNMLCLPATTTVTGGASALADAAAYCEAKRAFLLVDLPAADNAVQGTASVSAFNDACPRTPNGALYFPRLNIPDPLAESRPRSVGPSGTVAGIIARTDATRGVWKAPAGTDATLRNADLTLTLTDGDQGALNPQGINVMRAFPLFGNIVWGARTLVGSDQAASEWKYIPVRRTALYIEESLVQGLKWVVFEPNDEPLWAQIRLNVGTFLNGLFRQGAFQGATPRDAYFVKCDKDTTTQGDIDRGVVNIVVGFAPLKPAEFVVLQIQQIAGQTAA